MGIGLILSELLKQKNINVSDLAKQAGVTPSTLYSIIKRDNLKVDIDVLIKISETLGVTADYFYDRRTPADFSIHEMEIIKKYRVLDERGKKSVEDTLDREYGYATENAARPSENVAG